MRRRTTLAFDRLDLFLQLVAGGLFRFGNRRELCAERLGLFFESLIVLGYCSLVRGQVDRHVITESHCGEERAETVMIGLRNRIVLMIVTAGAGECEAEKCTGGCFCDVSQKLGAGGVLLVEQFCRVVMRAESQVTRG